MHECTHIRWISKKHRYTPKHYQHDNNKRVRMVTNISSRSDRYCVFDQRYTHIGTSYGKYPEKKIGILLLFFFNAGKRMIMGLFQRYRSSCGGYTDIRILLHLIEYHLGNTRPECPPFLDPGNVPDMK